MNKKYIINFMKYRFIYYENIKLIKYKYNWLWILKKYLSVYKLNEKIVLIKYEKNKLLNNKNNII